MALIAPGSHGGRSLLRWRGVSPNLHWYGLSGASSSFILFEIYFSILGKMTQALPHCLQFQFAGIPSMPIQLKLILLVNMFDNIEDLKQVSIFILNGFTSRTSTCLYSELHLTAVPFEFRNVQLKFIS
jgi:hypothetical protein